MVLAFAAAIIFSFPTLPWILARLKAPTCDAPAPHLPAHLDTRGAFLLPTPILAAGFLLSIAVLINSTLNPFLYFRF